MASNKLQLPVEPTVQDAWMNAFANATQGIREAPGRFSYWMQNQNPKTYQFYRDLEKNVLDVPTPIGTPDPVDLIQGLGAVVPPLIKAARKAKWTPEDIPSRYPQWLTDPVRDLYRKVYKIKEEVPVIRRQKEDVDFPVSAGSRGGVFVSPYKEYHNYSGSGGGEGGEFRVDTKYTPRNPLIIPRIEGAGFIGKRTLMKLFGQHTGETIPTYGHSFKYRHEDFQPNKIVDKILKHIDYLNNVDTKGTQAKQRIQALSKYAPKKEIEAVLDNPYSDIRSRLTELVANTKARESGYDSVWSVWPKEKNNSALQTKIEELYEKLYSLPGFDPGNDYIRYPNVLSAVNSYRRKYPEKVSRVNYDKPISETIFLENRKPGEPSIRNLISNAIERMEQNRRTAGLTSEFRSSSARITNIENLAKKLIGRQLPSFTPTQLSIVDRDFLRKGRELLRSEGYLKSKPAVQEFEKDDIFDSVINPLLMFGHKGGFNSYGDFVFKKYDIDAPPLTDDQINEMMKIATGLINK